MKKVCIVDDYDINLFILEEYLKKTFNTKSFLNAKDCINFIKNNKVDVVLMDCNMPQMDGYTASKLIKEIDPEIKVIAVTANSFKKDILKCIESGMDDVLVKPVFKEKVIDTINSKFFLEKI